MRKLYWYITAYLKKHGWIFIASSIVAIIVFSLLLPRLFNRLEKNSSTFVGVVGSYSLTSLPPIITEKLSAGLTKIESDGSVSPVLAERWTVEQDGTVYRFVLKQGLFWQDGKPLSTEDIQYPLREAEPIISQNDIVFRLPDTFAPFPSLVSAPIFRTGQLQHMLFFKKPTLIGIGSTKIIDYTSRGDRLTQIILETPEERLTYRFFLTEEDAITAFKRGEVDIVSNLTTTKDIHTWPTATITSSINHNQYLGIFFNHRDSRFFQKNVRQALAYALEKQTGEKNAISPINPHSWAYLEGGKRYDKNIERATERMLAELPSEPLTFELKTPATFISTAESIKRQWEEFGQQVYQSCLTSADVEDKAFCEHVKISVSITITRFIDTSNFTVYLLGQEIPPDPDQYYLWHSEQGTNFTGYKNTRIDSLLERGRKTLDREERIEIYQEFQQFLLEDIPVIFLEHLETYTIERS